MSPRAGKYLSRSLQLGVTALCFWYLFHDLDPAALGEALLAFSPWRLVFALPLFMLSLLPSCLRLNYLCGGRSSLYVSSKALFFGYGVNNLLPAKLGEIAKAAYLTRAKGIPAAVSLCAVFWERLADLNVVLAFSVVIGLWYGVTQLYLPLLCGMAVIWTTLLLLFRFPDAFMRMACLLPAGRLRDFAGSTLERLGDAQKRPKWRLLIVYSFAVWVAFILFTLWFFAVVCGNNIGIMGAALVCIAGGVGMILPSMPASLGAYEAGVVAALTILGADKEAALSAALALHMINIIPPVLFTGYSVLFEQVTLPGGQAPSPAAPVPCAGKTEPGSAPS
ncbi:MAG: flippase-like domain-containing protein [Desulfovibrionaceae bacterium]|nr:flippase-like domain-containing protein [Desulfovibrionaceae bacterium]